MKSNEYKTAVTALSIKDLGAFLKSQDILEVENWSSMRAPEKRENFMQALAASIEFRQKFVGFYNENSGENVDWITWEDAIDEAEPTEEPVSEGDTGEAEPAVPATTETFNISKAGTVGSSFVDGDFDKIVSDAAGLDANQSTAALRAVEEDLEFQHMRIGVLLSHIQKSQHYLTLECDNMREYLSKFTGLHYRKAMQLIQNADTVRDLEIPATALKGVSWAALRHVLPVLTKDNYATWLEAARSMKHVSLIAAVNDEKMKQAGALPAPDKTDAETMPKPSQKIFSVYPEQKETIDQAIEKAKIEANTDSAGAALEAMAASYIGKPPSDATVAAVMPDLSEDGLKNMFSKLRADEGLDGAVRILTVFGEIFSEIGVEVELPASL